MSISGGWHPAHTARVTWALACGLCAMADLPTLRAQALPAQGAQSQGVGSTPARVQYESGLVTVQGGIATIDLPPGWRYLQPEGARQIIEHVWRNRPNPSTLGLILPPTPWGGLIVSFDTRGYVTDDDAHEIDPHGMLKDLQLSLEAGLPARKRAGQPGVKLVAWAQPPEYDTVAHKLSWGRILEVEGVAVPTLNYDVRVLGAEGILALQAVGDMSARERIVADSRHVLTRIQFAEGLRYADHDPLRHRRAGHGVRRLVSVTTPPAVPFARLLVKPALAAAVIAAAVLLRRRQRAPSKI